MFFRDRAGTRRKVHLGTRPRLLAGTAIGTLATYLLFYHNYTQLQDDGGAPVHILPSLVLRVHPVLRHSLAHTRVLLCDNDPSLCAPYSQRRSRMGVVRYTL